MNDAPEELIELAREVLEGLGTIAPIGGGTEGSPFVLVKHNDDVQMRVRLYTRFNRTVVMRIDAMVWAYKGDPAARERLVNLTQWMPFCSVRFENGSNGTEAAFLTHSVLFQDAAAAAEVEQAIGSISYTWGRAMEAAMTVTAADDVPAVAVVDDEPELDDMVDDQVDGDDEEDVDDEYEVVEDDEEDEMTADKVLAELDKLVGLEPVKKMARQLVARQRLESARRRAGMKPVLPSPHLVFTGNPGTGKTTVARLIGQLYKSLGLLPRGHLVEANRSTLVGGYIGQTAIKTRTVCEQARGGVLFIDEAYSLMGSGHDYGSEAIEELLTFMENNRGKIAVVVAGYPEEMEQMLESNPGLKSRFDMNVEFPDYSNDELLEIFNVIARTNDYDPARVQRTVRYVVSTMPRGRGFGNGREMRKLFNQILDVHAERAARLRNPSDRVLRELAAADCLPSMRRAQAARRACRIANGEIARVVATADGREFAMGGYL